MSTLYTGNAGNVSLGSAISTTIPADGDALTAASVNTALQKVDDYLAAFRQTVNPGILIWNSFLSGDASSTTYRLTTAYPGAVLAPTADTVGQTQIVAPTAGTIRNFEYRTSQTNPQNAASNSVVISLTINGVIQAGMQITIPFGNGPSVFSTTGAVAVNAGDLLGIAHAVGAGVVGTFASVSAALTFSLA